MVLRFMPAASAAWKAWSRSGPTTPVVPARLSAWHAPHLAMNARLPAIRSGCRLTTPQAGSATASAATAATEPSAFAAAEPSPVMAADPMRSVGGTRRASGSRQAVQLAARGGDHGAGDAVPGPALAGDRHDRLAGDGAHAGRRGEPAG